METNICTKCSLFAFLSVFYFGVKNLKFTYGTFVFGLCKQGFFFQIMKNSYIYTLFFQKNNIMRFKNRFHITANGPLSAILRSFVRTSLIIVWTTLTSIFAASFRLHHKVWPHFLLIILWHKLHESAKLKNFQWVGPESHLGG
jgi:hypothetical protein